MNTLSFSIKPQYVKQTETKGKFPDEKGGFNKYPLHLVQKKMKEDFDSLPEFTIITAPTGTGKSYAFPFPVQKSKTNKRFSSSIRGLIVLPTNALIDELHENFTKTFPELKIGKITGKHLDELQKKRFDRWLEVINIAQENDLIITNPDIINYAMHGGYHNAYWGKTGKKEFPNLLQKFDYIVFDEYHLYDESQIANFFTLAYLRDIFLHENQKLKYLFVSATPENGLKEILKDFKLDYTEIFEEIVGSPESARAIHGKLEVEIHLTSKFSELIESKYNEIENQIKTGKKVLIIFDTIIDLMTFQHKISNYFPAYKIVTSSGYAPKDENQNEEIKNANIILATNKAEVGVNYDVEYAIMQPGKFYRNFVQRFGRVSRGNLDGKIVIALNENVQFNKFKKEMTNTELSYYEFLAIANSVFESKKFYAEIVPAFIGEYVWCIQKNLHNQEYFTRDFFQKRLNETNFFSNPKYYLRYKIFQDIDYKIFTLSQKYKNGTLTTEWIKWWNEYRNTYLTFRDSSKVVEIYDKELDKELSYSLEWILQYKQILNIETKEVNKTIIEKYTVGETKERDKDLQYEISTIPTLNSIPFITDFNSLRTDKQIQELYTGKVWELLKQKKKGINPIDTLQVEILTLLLELAKTFNRKRLKIQHIESNNQFL
jgi:CRISPR-associated endonuclease/helicase Cas3